MVQNECQQAYKDDTFYKTKFELVTWYLIWKTFRGDIISIVSIIPVLPGHLLRGSLFKKYPEFLWEMIVIMHVINFYFQTVFCGQNMHKENIVCLTSFSWAIHITHHCADFLIKNINCIYKVFFFSEVQLWPQLGLGLGQSWHT